MLGAVSFWIFSRFAIFNHFTTESVRITVFLNDFLRAQITGDLCYSQISRFNRSINIRNYICSAKDGSVFKVFRYGKRDLFGIYGQN